MRPRKVVVMIEMTTAEELKYLRDKRYWLDDLLAYSWRPEIHQVQVNVVKAGKVEKKGRPNHAGLLPPTWSPITKSYRKS